MVSKAISHIIDHHNQVENNHHHYWHQKLENLDGEEAKKIIDDLDHSNHHVGDYYRRNGMRISLDKNSEESTNLLRVMYCIVHGLRTDEGGKDKQVLPDEIFPTNPEQTDRKQVHDNLLLKYKQIYGDRKQESRSLASADLPEEIVVKAIAVSILSETNGSVKMAQDILSTAGLKILKSMDAKELRYLIGDLKAISTLTDDNSKC
ncbi:MAG: hypothetical protein K0R25_887 [Rickettsiaceae bacterium]|nr:hypothetical protein [Rickettsiaceae bacterium]